MTIAQGLPCQGAQDRLQAGCQGLTQARGETNKARPTSQLGTGGAVPRAHGAFRS